jgi:short-subunit dehydrogenase
MSYAGFSQVGSLTDIFETLESMISFNITAVTKLAIAVLPGFQKRGSGTIVNIGSEVGFAPLAFVPVYEPTKAYVPNFTQVLQQHSPEPASGFNSSAPQSLCPRAGITCGFQCLPLMLQQS